MRSRGSLCPNAEGVIEHGRVAERNLGAQYERGTQTLKGFPNGERETPDFGNPFWGCTFLACSFSRRALGDAGLCSATPLGSEPGTTGAG
jgi:hypothetical protein